MLIPHALIVASDALDSHDFLLWTEEPRIELAVWHKEEKDDTNRRRRQAYDKKNYLPTGDRCWVSLGANRDPISNDASYNLCLESNQYEYISEVFTPSTCHSIL